MARRPKKLGDVIESALSSVGITQDRISGWLGRPCGCHERALKLNRLGEWAYRVLHGKTAEPLVELDKMVGDAPPHPDKKN